MRGRTSFSVREADEIFELLSRKMEVGRAEQKSLRAKVRSIGFYISNFENHGPFSGADFHALIDDGVITVRHERSPSRPIAATAPAPTLRKSDEGYVIDLCDEVLGVRGLRQHTFEFLRGDAGTKLPVDVYYPDLSLVIEYRERQHFEPVGFFDRRETVSGVPRGEQRKRYDARRHEVLPQHGIDLVAIAYLDLAHHGNKRLIRRRQQDLLSVQGMLSSWTTH